MTLESDTQFLLTQGRAGCKGSSIGTLTKALWLILPAVLLASFKAPFPTDLEAAYEDKIHQDQSWDTSVKLWETPQAGLSPDSDVALLRDAYAAETMADTAQYVSETYGENLNAALIYLEEQRFKCTTSERITCESHFGVLPRRGSPSPDDPTHCITWRLEIQAKENAIEKVTPSSLVTDCNA